MNTSPSKSTPTFVGTELSPAPAGEHPSVAVSRGAADHIVAVLIWIANYGLSLSAADYALPAPEARESACPFAWFLQAMQKHL